VREKRKERYDGVMVLSGGADARRVGGESTEGVGRRLPHTMPNMEPMQEGVNARRLLLAVQDSAPTTASAYASVGRHEHTRLRSP
jgi:hypothetical protein